MISRFQQFFFSFFIYSGFIQFLLLECFKSSYFKKMIHGLNKLLLVVEIDIIKILKIINKWLYDI